ncbi:type I polyketide synthase [Lentzea flaviverrucosa]|uniref:Enediyne polyketide synthase n=1 Tax=Lentzea flaviverrucosa TaxID=200379 RepID=A0A1H9HJP0_9PSEU|nr:type I polyketide synthase [Lentzea flaviverrucosa]RDI34566.1 enediyne polyketide synthase [Lentzea flaviverrucosa]SEQ62570.1 enediyne polyketide synthase [Lentzea flaviverrucosa]
MSTPRIAIVGMACRYPDASTPEELWQTVLGRRRAFRAIPPERLDLADYGGEPSEVDKTVARRAAVLRNWTFDRAGFRVPGALYRAVDPTHWLALDTARAALEDAGVPGGEGVDRDRTGVFIGNSLAGEFSRASLLRLRWPSLRHVVGAALEESGVEGDTAAKVLATAERVLKAPFPVPDDEMLAGGLSNTIAGRVCNHFDFHGAGYTVDGACSSSLLAVITASEALARGELSFALAGGVDLSLDPFELIGFARVGALSAGEMRVYDAKPTGFLPGEGCGIVALMRAEDAEARGLRIYAHLVGWGMSSDGAGGVTRPAVGGQTRALRRAYARAGLLPAAAGLIEGHGTGTAVGDQVELEALLAVRGFSSPVAALGSVKANIGHTKAAAGVAGLIKAALAVSHRVIPPMTGVRELHPLLAGPAAGLRLPGEPEPWTHRNPVAGVSSAGFGGINTHVVLDAGVRTAMTRRVPRRLVPAATEPAATLPDSARHWSAPLPEWEPFLITASDLAELDDRLGTLGERCAAMSEAELHDLAATLTARHDPRAAVRCVLVAADPAGLAAAATAARKQLPGWDSNLLVDEPAGVVVGRGSGVRVGLLLPGQAAPVRAALGLPGRLLPHPPSTPDGLVDGAADTAIAQPAVVWQSLTGLAWLRHLGCHPVAALGHSLGELTALAWAGVLTEEQVLDLAAHRGRLMAEHGTRGTGMISVAAPAEAALDLAESTEAVLAAENGPQAVVLAGPVAALDVVAVRAAAAGVHVAKLPVSHGFHSSAMSGVTRPWREYLREVPMVAPDKPVFSTVTGTRLGPFDDVAALLVEQLTEPVRFLEAVRELAARCDLLVEAGPGTMLATLAAPAGLPAVSLDCGGSARRTAFASATLFASATAKPQAWFGDRAHRLVDLDTPLEFLANPCESLPKNGVRQSATAPVEVSEVVETAPAASGTDLLTAVREYLAEELELPVSAITDDTMLLSDLHVNSLQVVRLVSEIAARHGRQLVLDESLDGVTVGGLARRLEELPEDAQDGQTELSGVRPWVGLFSHHWVPLGPSPERSAAHDPAELVVELPGTAGTAEIARLLREIAGSAPRRLLLTHTGHPAAAAVGRAVSAELPGCAVTVLDAPPGENAPAVAAAASVTPASGYAELRVRDGVVERLVTRPHAGSPGSAALPLGPGDVCLVSGGATGITARCAAALAGETGAQLVVLGRRPADDPDVAAEVAALGADYVSCDLTDPAAVRAAVREAARFGPVRGLLHGAGVNQPRRLAEVGEEGLAATVAPKVHGLRELLSAVEEVVPGEQLRLVVAFGSIIGRQGLAGQSEYCVANDWMRAELEHWARRNPRCRTHLLEWSAWSGVGMADRMRVTTQLSRLGLALIEPGQGVTAMLGALTDPSAPVTLLVTGRFPPSATLRVEPEHHPSPAGLRFAEELRSWVPGVETIAEATLNTGTDPYLSEHRVSGVLVLPAVIGAEAMAQTAALTTGPRGSWTFHDLRLHRPVTVGERSDRVIRVAALARHDRQVDLSVRQDGDGFGADHLSASLVPSAPPPARRAAVDAVPAGPPHHAYGSVLFHSGRFQRVVRYEVLSAFTVTAWLHAREDTWFAEYHGSRLLLGDPAAHDATIHALLPCVPHKRALPVEVEELNVWRRPAGMLLVHAVETWHSADEFLFDVDLVQPDGLPVARWTGLRLKVVGDGDLAGPLPWDQTGPWLSRRLVECGWAHRIEVWSDGDLLVADRSAGLHWTPGDEDPGTAARQALARLGASGPVVFDEVTEDGLMSGVVRGIRVVVARRVTDIGPVTVALAFGEEHDDA